MFCEGGGGSLSVKGGRGHSRWGWIFVSERGEGDIRVGHACMLMESGIVQVARRHWWAEV